MLTAFNELQKPRAERAAFHGGGPAYLFISNLKKYSGVLGDEGAVCVNVKDNYSSVSGKWR